MKTIIGFSNFSFNEGLFSSYSELETAFLSLKNIKPDYKQAKIDFIVANDIMVDDYFGTSIDHQISNFEYGMDVGVKTAFYMNLQRNYLNGFNLALTSEELKHNSVNQPDIQNNKYYVNYIPTLEIIGITGFKDKSDFDSNYEYVLSKYPIGINSFYERLSSHFTNVIYQIDCESTLGNIQDGDIHKFSKSFVKCIGVLNSYVPTMDIVEDLKVIAGFAKYDCTTQGSNGKENMKFNFPEVSTLNKINCEFHLKPNNSNDPRDGNYYHNRIYFTFANIKGVNKILIASIGPHL